MEQDGGLDVLLVGVALGDSGMMYDSLFRHFYQSEKTLMRTEREQQRETLSVLPVFVLCKHYFLIHPQGVKVRQVFFSFKCHKVIYKTIRISTHFTKPWFM